MCHMKTKAGTLYRLVQLPNRDLLFVRSVLFFDGLVIIWVYRCFFSLAAREATLVNSCNVHKSKMTAMDSGWDTIIQLVNSE